MCRRRLSIIAQWGGHLVKKYLLFSILVVIGTFADLYTKTLAENSLASPGYPHSALDFTLTDEDREGTLGDYLSTQFEENTAEEIEIFAQWTEISYGENEARPGYTEVPLAGAESISVRYRSITLIDWCPGDEDCNFLGLHYVENRGAAWGFLSNYEGSWRRGFFITVGLIAVCFILYLVVRAEPERILLITSLGFVIGGALGNIADRIRYGYVVDFIAWHPFFAWPTFNIADSLICVGVALLFIDGYLDQKRNPIQEEKS